MKTLKLSLGALVVTSALLGTTASADEHALNAEQLQAAVLAGGCAGCHGTDGRRDALNGRAATVLERQLLSFKNDERPSTIMGRIAKGYSDEEIAEIAQYFASLDN
ncbi:c-type cytochrome [Salinispirillum marinum]|uniref:C-type cytochrome n=2 Tax=Saccharospirillaceae TaxID=255527 RepID=A0ABV8BAD8_9GAMM